LYISNTLKLSARYIDWPSGELDGLNGSADSINILPLECSRLLMSTSAKEVTIVWLQILEVATETGSAMPLQAYLYMSIAGVVSLTSEESSVYPEWTVRQRS